MINYISLYNLQMQKNNNIGLMMYDIVNYMQVMIWVEEFYFLYINDCNIERFIYFLYFFYLFNFNYYKIVYIF